VEEARINALQNQKEAQNVLKKGKEVSVPKVRMNASHAVNLTMTAGKSAAELVVQASVPLAVQANAVPVPVVEKKGLKDHLHVPARGHLPQEDLAQVKNLAVVEAAALHPKRAMVNVANARHQRNSVRKDRVQPAMHAPQAEAWVVARTATVNGAA